MKKFSNLNETIEQKYEGKDYLRNDLYNLIEKTLNVKFESDAEKFANIDVNIQGKEDLVEELKKYIDEVKKQEAIKVLENIKINFHHNFDMKWLNEQIQSLNELHWNDVMRNCTSLKALQEYQAQDPDNRTLEDYRNNMKVLKDAKEKYWYFFNIVGGDQIKFYQQIAQGV
jgi:hypothetical protein